jgi:hypothetical protein
VVRYGERSIFQVALSLGAISEIPLPSDFSAVDDFVVTTRDIWLLHTADGGDGPSRIGRLDRATGELQTVSRKVRSAGPYKDGILAVTWEPDGAAQVDSTGFHDVDSKALGTLTDKMGIATEVAAAPSGVWWADTTAQSVVWLDPDSGNARIFRLPAYQIPGAIHCPPVSGQPNPCGGPFSVFTQVNSIAVSPSGDLYFADATMNRVGIVPAQ